MPRLDGHHALVTGGGTGIGAAIAAALAADGAVVTVAGRRREPLEDVCRVLPQARAVVADVTRESDCHAMVRSATEPLPGPPCTNAFTPLLATASTAVALTPA